MNWSTGDMSPARRDATTRVPWSYEDEALYYTAVALDRLRRGLELEPDLHTFPLDDPDEYIVASGPYRRYFFGPAGGSTVLTHSYHSRDPMSLKNVTAVVNSLTRPQAEREVEQQWRSLDSGTLYVSNASLYFETWGGVRPWSFEGIDVAYMTARSQFRFNGSSDQGNDVHWLVTSAWAELGFALWAVTRSVPHPHLLTLFPEEWRARARARGLALPRLDP